MTAYFVATDGNDANDGLSELTAWATPGYAASQALTLTSIAADQSWIYIKNGTYTLTSLTLNISGGPPSLANGVQMEAYATVPSDMGGDVVVSAGGLAIPIVCGVATPNFNRSNVGYVNITVDGTDTATVGFDLSQNYTAVAWRCRATKCVDGFNLSGMGVVQDCMSDYCTYGFRGNADSSAFRCLADSCSNAGFYHMAKVTDCIASRNLQHGFHSGVFVTAHLGCTSYANKKSGFYMTYDIGHMMSCLSVQNTRYGFEFGGAHSDILFAGNADYGNGLTATRRVMKVREHITLTAQPCVDAAGGDYSLNDVAGGGAELKRLATSFKGISTQISRHVGAVSQIISGGGGGTQGFPASRLAV